MAGFAWGIVPTFSQRIVNTHARLGHHHHILCPPCYSTRQREHTPPPIPWNTGRCWAIPWNRTPHYTHCYKYWGEGVDFSDDEKKGERFWSPSKILQRGTTRDAIPYNAARSRHSRTSAFSLTSPQSTPDVPDWELAKLAFPSHIAFTTPRLCKST
jgi:hypothetical protein